MKSVLQLISTRAAALSSSDCDADDAALAGGALAERRLHALLAEVLDRLLHVAAGLGQRLLALHHALAGLGPEFVDEFRGDLRHVWFSVICPCELVLDVPGCDARASRRCT